PGVSLLILNPAGLPADEGELVIVGPTVGSHYLGEEKPLRKYIRIGKEELPAYATGDRVALKNGTLVYLGRLDEEFKISGHRVQPREIEARLLCLQNVSQASVQGFVDNKGRRRLAAFVSGDPSLSPESICSALRSALPPALMLGIINVLPALPLNSANKID